MKEDMLWTQNTGNPACVASKQRDHTLFTSVLGVLKHTRLAPHFGGRSRTFQDMGSGDRGGGREAKGSSLKTSKNNPGSVVAKAKRAPVLATSQGSPESFPAPILTSSKEPYIDCAAAILSRQFDRDRDRVLSRAREEGCCAVLEWISDIEKQVCIYTCDGYI